MIPTLAADPTFVECLRSLERQTFTDFEVIVVDNSGKRRVREAPESQAARVRIIENETNAGFGRAFNQAYAESNAPFLAVLNDDAEAEPEWLGELLAAMESQPAVGMCASQVLLHGSAEPRIDSFGMLLCRDGSSKQQGHGQPPGTGKRPVHVLLPSGSAALYRREMLAETGVFDDTFFLYCEDTDLGLRARWLAWECLAVPTAIVHHRYSHSAGRASALKAFYVERNRLFLVMKNFPASMLWSAPFYAAARYGWHLYYMLRGQGKAAEFHESGGSPLELPMCVIRAHAALLMSLPRLWKERRKIRATRRLTPRQFELLTRSYRISTREVAAA